LHPSKEEEKPYHKEDLDAPPAPLLLKHLNYKANL
jgi:hypothetical protein